jgi:hypothetical protein
MEGIRGVRWGKMLLARTPALGDEADVEDEREDGNLIEGEGIFLGKQGTVVEFAGDVDSGRTRIWKLSYNSGGSRFRI